MKYQRNRMNKFLLVAVVWATWSSQIANAASEEIQVYLDDKEAPGDVSIDWHNNYVFSNRLAPEYAGQRPSEHVYRLTPEINIGLTDTLEFGIYLLTSHDAEGGLNGDGGKLRLKYIAPHESEGMFWGVNLEMGKQALAVAPKPWNAELKGILGWHLGPWTLGANISAESAMDVRGGPVTGGLDIKANYAITQKTQIGLESYNDLGPLSHFQSLSANSKTMYAVIDTEIGEYGFNAGIGRGLNAVSDQWILKFIVSTKF